MKKSSNGTKATAMVRRYIGTSENYKNAARVANVSLRTIYRWANGEAYPDLQQFLMLLDDAERSGRGADDKSAPDHDRKLKGKSRKRLYVCGFCAFDRSVKVTFQTIEKSGKACYNGYVEREKPLGKK